ncbi:MAG: hypothetical protein GY804_07910 [Alphaproteobacteria bacterium]|nr:hypothetical protein [Alphaproteobacteria bacterium]
MSAVIIKFFITTFIILPLFLLLSLCNFSSIDTEIKDHPLIGKTISTPGYAIITKGSNPSINTSPVQKEINANIMTIDSRLSVISYPDKDINTSFVLPPNSKLKVEKIFINTPRFLPENVFTSGYQFAILKDENERAFIGPVFGEQINFETNGCTDRRCKNWEFIFKECFAKNVNNICDIHIEFYLLNDQGFIDFDANNPPPPYKDGIMENSQKPWAAFAKKHKIKTTLDKHHPYASSTVTINNLGDMLLHHEKLNIKKLSTLHRIE